MDALYGSLSGAAGSQIERWIVYSTPPQNIRNILVVADAGVARDDQTHTILHGLRILEKLASH
ncbi:MAG: hypothetical protein O3A51_02730 [Verrucomicrobia bacterium]|nr:hypothetical protein [Verrucomicrobiota bacterium]